MKRLIIGLLVLGGLSFCSFCLANGPNDTFHNNSPSSHIQKLQSDTLLEGPVDLMPNLRGTYALDYPPNGYTLDSFGIPCSVYRLQSSTTVTPLTYSLSTIYLVKEKQISGVVLTKINTLQRVPLLGLLDLDIFAGLQGNGQTIGGLALTHSWPLNLLSGHAYFEAGIAVATLEGHAVDGGILIAAGYKF